MKKSKKSNKKKVQERTDYYLLSILVGIIVIILFALIISWKYENKHEDKINKNLSDYSCEDLKIAILKDQSYDPRIDKFVNGIHCNIYDCFSKNQIVDIAIEKGCSI